MLEEAFIPVICHEDSVSLLGFFLGHNSELLCMVNEFLEVVRLHCIDDCEKVFPVRHPLIALLARQVLRNRWLL
jgi:hypothetical protein